MAACVNLSSQSISQHGATKEGDGDRVANGGVHTLTPVFDKRNPVNRDSRVSVAHVLRRAEVAYEQRQNGEELLFRELPQMEVSQSVNQCLVGAHHAPGSCKYTKTESHPPARSGVRALCL